MTHPRVPRVLEAEPRERTLTSAQAIGGLVGSFRLGPASSANWLRRPRELDVTVTARAARLAGYCIAAPPRVASAGPRIPIVPT